MTAELIDISKRQRMNWVTSIVLVLLHTGAVAALFMFSWRALAITIFLYWMTICLGISMGYHRLHTHRSYQVPRFLEYFFAICGTMTLEGGPIFWVATHRIHHQKSDQPGDPHSPRDGAWWSHVGWILFGESNHSNTRAMGKYAPDLMKDPFYVWLNNYHWVPLTVLGAGLLAFGGWSVFLWASCVRIVFGLHATWLVNSATHMWGSRRCSVSRYRRIEVIGVFSSWVTALMKASCCSLRRISRTRKNVLSTTPLIRTVSSSTPRKSRIPLRQLRKNQPT